MYNTSAFPFIILPMLHVVIIILVTISRVIFKEYILAQTLQIDSLDIFLIYISECPLDHGNLVVRSIVRTLGIDPA